MNTKKTQPRCLQKTLGFKQNIVLEQRQKRIVKNYLRLVRIIDESEYSPDTKRRAYTGLGKRNFQRLYFSEDV